jgi:modulator of FtsH protease HflK
MGWNESEGKDPWNNRKKQPNAPDLDKLLSNFQKKIAGVINQGKGGDGAGNGSDDKVFTFFAVAAFLFVLVIWAMSGFFTVKPSEEVVILRFGRYLTAVSPGLHWIPRGIESTYRVDVQQVESYEYPAEMLTKDENIVKVAIAVQYRKADPKAYLFNVDDPIESLRQATASALRQVIGGNDLTQILTSGRTRIALAVEEHLKMLLDSYGTGLEIIKVAMQPAKAPDAVQDAFDDAIKAQEDEQRYVKQAEAYRLQVLPQAEGQSKRLLADARAYREQVVFNAKGEIALFDALLPQYKQAPEVMRQRLYLTALENIFKNSTKILMDSQQGSNNLFYLPLDQLLKAQSPIKQVPSLQVHATPSASSESASQRAASTANSRYSANYNRNDYRGRGY